MGARQDVIITLEQPNVDLPYLLTDRHLIIQPNGGYDAPEAAIGTGRYILKQVNKGASQKRTPTIGTRLAMPVPSSCM